MIELYPHQQKALDMTADMNRAAYYLDMGLGKTYVGSEKMMQLGGKVNLVICQKSKINDWLEHFVKQYDAACCTFDMTKKQGYEAFVWEIAKCPKDYQINLVIGIINYELAFRRPELLKLNIDTLMLDESSMIQNEKAKRSKFILKLKPKNVILLSGTPSSGKYENLWSQLHLLGWDISLKLYQQQYVNWTTIEAGGLPIKVVNKSDPYKNADRLKRKMREHGAVFMKTDEAFELPEQNFINVKVNAPAAYRKFMKNCIATVKPLCSNVVGLEGGTEKELIGDTTLTKLLYARMICAQYSKEKLQAFEDLIYATNERIIVFYNFNEELDILYQTALKKTPNVSIVNGKRKDLQAYELYSDSITFVQYQAGAMGLNLQKANRIIYYSLPLSSELFEQSKKRIHRIGQKQPCFYYLMLCRNTVEERILETLDQRSDYTNKLFQEE